MMLTRRLPTIGGLRDLLRQRPDGPLAATPARVATALAQLQTMLRAISSGDLERPEVTAVTAVPHAARGLVGCFNEGGHFEGGIPGETRATVLVLDTLDPGRMWSYGTRGQERTAHESDVHRSLAMDLASHLAIEVGAITHADGFGASPQPYAVGRHRPDIVGRTPGGDLFLGEAKLGPELMHVHTQEQLQDFLTYRPDGIAVPLHLIVPEGWRAAAEEAAFQAAGSTETLVVHTVANVPGAPRPPQGR